jgi:hypothetical protein
LELCKCCLNLELTIKDTLQKVIRVVQVETLNGSKLNLHSCLVDVVRCLSLGKFKHVKVCQLETLFELLKNIHKIILNKLNL